MIDVEVDLDLLSLLQLIAHLPVRNQDLLFQPYTHESADRGDIRDPDPRNLPHLHERGLRRCNESIPGIPVNKYQELVPELLSRGELANGKEHALSLRVLQIDSEILLSPDSKLLGLPQFQHCKIPPPPDFEY